MKLKLTKVAIQNLPYAAAGAPAYIVRDAAVRNFFLLVGTRTKTFAVQRDVRDAEGHRRTVRRALGRWSEVPGAGVTPEMARHGAIAALAEINATSGQAALPDGVTLAQAVALFSHAKSSKGQPRAEKTQHRYAQFVRAGYIAAWMERPLRSITPTEVRLRHDALTEEVAAGMYAGAKAGRSMPERQGGRTTADDVMRWFRAVYNLAVEEDDTLPRNPCIALKRKWHNVKTERTAIPSEKLAAWYTGVMAIPNGVRRDYLLFVLFSGLRRESAATMRWADVDFEREVLRIPKPKGGEERAFDLPLSDYLVELLRERQCENPLLVEQQMVPAEALEWVWPAYGASGHVAEPRVDIPGVPYTIHDLRRTFITEAEGMDIPLHVIGALVNHKQPGGSMTADYVAHKVERLRAPMQQIADQLRVLIAGPGPANVVPMRRKK